ncbi:MAG TPA: ABC-2 family transporter protein [Acidimicrobiales bacterium]|nr:ABC-2 family transporter protein [Acidimicrobiales bacterium]
MIATRPLRVPAALAARRLLADRAGLAVSLLFYLLVSTVLSGLWRAAAGESGDVVGYSAIALTWYIFTTEAAIGALNARLIEEVGDDIVSGSVSVELLRPAAVVGVRLATTTGRSLARLAPLFAVGIPAAWALSGPPPSWPALALAVPSLVLAVAVNVALQHAAAAASFWLRDSRSAWFIYQKLVFILGGMLLPLQVLPDAVFAVAIRSPFAAMAYAPGRIASGHFEPELLLMQAGWLAVTTAFAISMFAAGQRRLQVVGG